MPFTNAEKYKCAERELAMRYRVYERWVDAGKMKRATADREYALMEDIAAHFRELVEAERAAQALPLELPPAPMLRVVKE
jgi:hypothetical protein